LDAVSASVTIGRSPEEVYDYLVDVANHPEFSDHYLVDWHLTRTDSRGQGAGARFRLKTRRYRFAWADMTIIEAQRPRRIVQAGRGGKYNRTRLVSIFTISPGPSGSARVSLTVETEPATLADRLNETLGMRAWMRRQTVRAVRRIRTILEEGSGRGPRATIAGL
jgi:uncharacterized protein YndB with AHSA1/START domain